MEAISAPFGVWIWKYWPEGRFRTSYTKKECPVWPVEMTVIFIISGYKLGHSPFQNGYIKLLESLKLNSDNTGFLLYWYIPYIY